MASHVNTMPNLLKGSSCIKSSLIAIMGTAWHSRHIKCIFFGDYELVCACYGLSSPTGRTEAMSLSLFNKGCKWNCHQNSSLHMKSDLYSIWIKI